MRQFLPRNISWIVFLIAIVLLICHVVGWKQITVDTTGLLLLAILLVCPFIEQLRKIKVGGFEFEAEKIDPSEVKKVKLEVEKRLGPSEVIESVTSEVRSIRDSLLDLLDRDHVLALAKLRMELERVLTRLHLLATPTTKHRRFVSLNRVVSDLVQSNILPSQLSSPIREVLYLCNRAVHGEHVRIVDARNILNIGIRILEEIDSFIEGFIDKPRETQPLSQADVNVYRDAKYQVTTVIPYVKNPVRNMYILDQEGLEMFLEGYDEYAEFLVSIEKIETQAK